MYALACGPHIGVKKYAGCIVNGVRFHTKDRNAHTRTQTCGVMVEGYHVNKLIDFYGVIDEILVVEYVKDKKVVLFKCEWFKLDGRKKGIQTDGHVTSINVGSLWYENDSFILADQAKQVFYLKDTKLGKDWKVVRKCRHRHIFDVPIAPSEVVDSEEVQDNVDIAFQEEVSNVDASLVIEEQHLIGLSRSNLDAEIVDATQVRIVESDHAVEDDEIFVDDCEEVDDTLEDYLSDVEVAQCVEVESDEDADVEV
ncbi:unnamed protein product [Linum trigynum]|uniref:DUF4216 domain-containing protein n=1 Tax=Linum trigynum TaxID=586398 RepID=A0AAV2GC10_9ROSI